MGVLEYATAALDPDDGMHIREFARNENALEFASNTADSIRLANRSGKKAIYQ